MTSVVFPRRPSSKPNASLYLDRSAPLGNTISACYMFNRSGVGSSEPNLAYPLGKLTLQAGLTRTIGLGGRGVTGTNATNSYASNSQTASQLGVDGSKRRTVAFRFKAAASSAAGNQGGIVSYGSQAGPGNTFFSVRQVNDPSPNNTADLWCVDYAGGKMYFSVPSTAGKVHTVVVTYDGTALTAYVDGSFNVSQIAALATSSTSVDVGRALFAADAAKFYFHGTVLESVVANLDWHPRQVAEWHRNTSSVLRRSRVLFPVPVFGNDINVNLTGIPAGGGFGLLSVSQFAIEVGLTGIPAGGGFGNLNMFITDKLTQTVGLTGIPAGGGFGNLSFANQPGFWLPNTPSGGEWVPIQNAQGG